MYSPPSSVQCSAPVFSVPNDVLQDIFLLARESEGWSALGESSTGLEDSRESSTWSLSMSTFPLRASHVCPVWRNLALATPSLWSCIRVRSTSSIAYVEAYLDHSSTALLDVDVNLDRGWFLQEQVLAKIRTILTTILGHSKRLSRVFLHCVSEDARMMSAISLFCSSHASNLEKLYIGLEHLQGLSATAHVPLDPSCPTIFATGTPKLRHLHLQGLAIQKFRPPLSTLTVLELVQSVAPSITYMALRTILTTPVALAHLSLRGAIVTSENIPEFPSPDHLIPLPALETLRLCGDPSANAFTRILTHSSLPRLRTLVLVELNEVDLELDFSGTEFPSLTVLVFIDFDISKVVYSRLFAAFPKIESFICSYSTLDTSSSTKLLVEAGAGGLWPCLKSLAFAFDEEDSGVKELVKGRQDLLCPLTTLRFITEDEEALSLWLEWLEEVDSPLKREEGTITYMGCHLKSWSYPERQWPLSSMDLD